MSWREIKAKWEADPTFREAYDQEYPYAAMASAVARLRAENRLTQEGLAQLVGTTQSVIARLEGGRHAVSVSMFRRIAKALNLHWDIQFRAAGAEQPNEQPAVNEVAVPAADVLVNATYILDSKTFTFSWPDDYAWPNPDSIFYRLDQVTDVLLDFEEPPSVPLSAPASKGSTVFFGNYPPMSTRRPETAMAHN